jgi:hypothetical protein
MKKYLFVVLISVIFASNIDAQFKLTGSFGMLQTLSAVQSSSNDSPYISGWEKTFSNDGFNGDSYLFIELTYQKNKNLYGVRYNFNDFVLDRCVRVNDNLKYCSAFIERHINLTFVYKREIKVSKKFIFLPTIGFGIYKLDGNINGGTTGGLVTYYQRPYTSDLSITSQSEYQFLVPLELSLEYNFNPIFNLGFILGAQLPLEPNNIKEEGTYNFLNDNIKKSISINNMTRAMYIGLNASIKFGLK